jgi:hypothetical protein
MVRSVIALNNANGIHFYFSHTIYYEHNHSLTSVSCSVYTISLAMVSYLWASSLLKNGRLGLKFSILQWETKM